MGRGMEMRGAATHNNDYKYDINHNHNYYYTHKYDDDHDGANHYHHLIAAYDDGAVHYGPAIYYDYVSGGHYNYDHIGGDDDNDPTECEYNYSWLHNYYCDQHDNPRATQHGTSRLSVAVRILGWWLVDAWRRSIDRYT